MARLILSSNKFKRALRVRKKVSGDKDTPRLSIFRSNKFVYGQIIDDVAKKTLVDVQGETKKLHGGKKKIDGAFEAGKKLAEKAIEKKIKTVVFDRKSYKYHGRVKRFAEGAREGGLKF